MSILSIAGSCAAFVRPPRENAIDGQRAKCRLYIRRGPSQRHLSSVNAADLDFDACAPPISDDTPCSELPAGADFPSPAELAALGPRGTKGGHRVVGRYIVPPCGLDLNAIPPAITDLGDVVSRLNITSDDATLPVALASLDPARYPSLATARKACRKGSILIGGGRENNSGRFFEEEQRPAKPKARTRWRRGRVGDRVRPGDVVGRQAFTGDFKRRRCYPSITYGQPSFELPVLFEDDHMAIVNKPAGVGIYGHRKSRSGSRSRRTVLAALPFALNPPGKGTEGGALRRPAPVHRLDTPTSGLVVVAKTAAARRHLYQQFHDRVVRKMYTAIVNGIPQCGGADNSSLLPSDNHTHEWSVIDYPLGGKPAVTSWRILRSVDSLNAKDGRLTLVSIALHTGRYHQIRRHMAWVCRRPLVGDALYAGGMQARHFRRRGLCLCSSGVTVRHPYFNTETGRRYWLGLDEKSEEKYRSGMIQLSEDGFVEVSVLLDVPKKFDKLLNGEEEWAKRSHQP